MVLVLPGAATPAEEAGAPDTPFKSLADSRAKVSPISPARPGRASDWPIADHVLPPRPIPVTRVMWAQPGARYPTSWSPWLGAEGGTGPRAHKGHRGHAGLVFRRPFWNSFMLIGGKTAKEAGGSPRKPSPAPRVVGWGHHVHETRARERAVGGVPRFLGVPRPPRLPSAPGWLQAGLGTAAWDGSRSCLCPWRGAEGHPTAALSGPQSGPIWSVLPSGQAHGRWWVVQRRGSDRSVTTGVSLVGQGNSRWDPLSPEV